ncbi:hypothetical protein LXA43DRAFT_974837 [Ganoderma leucocontextum]|nr:hypothetical protein LXA43DRAFT_974837 [Ganoderma leucocontextum]
MADTLSAAINDDHPLALELSSLRSAVSRYQHEAHAASLKLQRHSLEASQALDHARALERENARLQEELAVLRAHPDTTPSPAAAQVPELTLALRRLSHKLTAVEETLLARMKEVVDVRSELTGVQHDLEAARALTAEARAREEEGLARERALEQKVRAAEEERRMADLVVQEYADLVRKLEGRPKVAVSSPSTSTSSFDLHRSSNGSTTTLVDTLAEGKLGLQKLLEEFNGRNEQLQADVAQLHGDNGLLYKELEVARQGARHDRDELAKALHELDKYRADDNTATKMVSRYMKFSQSSTDTLQKAMDALKARHAATLTTLNAEIAQLQRALAHERDESERVRTVLDELTEDIAREAYGRRREVSLRLAFLGREENLAEHLRRWARKAKESLERSSGSEDGSISLNPMALREAFAKATADAEALLDTLNEQPSAETEGIAVGSIARLLLARDTVASLTHELQEETIRRLNTERKVARLETAEHSEQPQDLDHTPPVVHPIPHHVAEERHFLEVGVSASVEALSAALGSQFPVDHISPSDSVPIVDVITVPAAEEVSSLVTVDCPVRSVSIPTIPDELSPSPPSDSSVELPKVDPPAQSETVLALGVPDDARLKVLQSELVIPPSETSEVTEDASDIALPSAAESPALELPCTTLPTLPSSSSLPDPVHDSTSTPAPDLRNTLQMLKSHVPPPLPLEATGLALSSLSPSFNSTTLPAGEGKETSLLVDLAKVKHRYDDIQRGFRDCQLALKELKRSLGSLPLQTAPSSSDMASVLGKAVERLGDFNEDARVELEIRIADEERIASGYEALLSIPGAMSSCDDTNTEKMDEREVIKEVRAFVDGTDHAVAKAIQQFTQKLDDLEHDIASIKRTLYEMTSTSFDDALSPSMSIPSAKPIPSPSWSAWTPSFLSPPRSTSPAPTFGSVMTSPRLRHSSSFSHPRERSNDDPPTDPLANLGLRIVVPLARSPGYSPGLSTSPLGRPRGGPRQRTTSGMFMLGLGMRSASTPLGPRIGRQGLRETSSPSSLAGSSTSLASVAVPSNHAQAAVTANGGVLEVGGHNLDVE